ncbi:hypothetical protein [Streptomyces pseudogriseolus]|uniref:hypothetical protein n=1 Tax=Streptomyces pseudogriseolus TaxID=36817 RepID=UPI003FA278EF
MGNLGKYQEITTLAGELGGVDKFLDSVEKAAYEKGVAAGIEKATAAGREGIAVALRKGMAAGFNRGVAAGFNKGTVVGVVIGGAAAGGAAVAAQWYKSRKERAEKTQERPQPGAPESEDSGA